MQCKKEHGRLDLWLVLGGSTNWIGQPRDDPFPLRKGDLSSLMLLGSEYGGAAQNRRPLSSTSRLDRRNLVVRFPLFTEKTSDLPLEFLPTMAWLGLFLHEQAEASAIGLEERLRLNLFGSSTGTSGPNRFRRSGPERPGGKRAPSSVFIPKFGAKAEVQPSNPPTFECDGLASNPPTLECDGAFRTETQRTEI